MNYNSHILKDTEFPVFLNLRERKPMCLKVLGDTKHIIDKSILQDLKSLSSYQK